MTGSGRRALNTWRIALLLALALGLCAAAAPARAVVEGTEAQSTYGQVQIYVSNTDLNEPNDFRCGGHAHRPEVGADRQALRHEIGRE